VCEQALLLRLPIPLFLRDIDADYVLHTLIPRCVPQYLQSPRHRNLAEDGRDQVEYSETNGCFTCGSESLLHQICPAHCPSTNRWYHSRPKSARPTILIVRVCIC